MVYRSSQTRGRRLLATLKFFCYSSTRTSSGVEHSFFSWPSLSPYLVDVLVWRAPILTINFISEKSFYNTNPVI